MVDAHCIIIIRECKHFRYIKMNPEKGLASLCIIALHYINQIWIWKSVLLKFQSLCRLGLLVISLLVILPLRHLTTRHLTIWKIDRLDIFPIGHLPTGHLTSWTFDRLRSSKNIRKIKFRKSGYPNSGGPVSSLGDHSCQILAPWDVNCGRETHTHTDTDRVLELAIIY